MDETLEVIFKKEQEKMLEGLKKFDEELKARIEAVGGEEKFKEMINENLRKNAEKRRKENKEYEEIVRKQSRISDDFWYRRFDF